MSRIRCIGWKTLKGMKKQHYFKFTYNGDSAMHCRAETSNSMSISGRMPISIEIGRLITNNTLPKCKKCKKESERVQRIRKEFKV